MTGAMTGRRNAAFALFLVMLLALQPACSRSTHDQIPEQIQLTVVYDNNPHDARLQTDWGFACWVQYGDTVVLFDTGASGELLLENLGTLGLDPRDVDIVVLSHIHGDHTGGMEGLLATGVRPEVYVPATFRTSYKNELRGQVTLHEVTKWQEIIPGVHTTGKVGYNPPEQALVFRTCEGSVVITGCAHPGISLLVERAKEVGGQDIYLVLGGFHLGGASAPAVQRISDTFHELGVQNVAPCHCTGEHSMDIFAHDFGAHFMRAGVGWGVGFCDLGKS
jgi:7,8-dihydropterin-6-yl-methyl-4-(beta-D-ribofuranosyl)aminobenzene 5'-phosphate synthase